MDARYAELEAEMEKPKDEKKKGSGVDYGALTAAALNAHTASPEFKAEWKAYLEWLPEDLLTPAQRQELEELRKEEAAENSLAGETGVSPKRGETPS